MFLIFLHTSSPNPHLQFLRSFSPASHSHTTASSSTLQAPPTHPVHPQAKSVWAPSPLTTIRHTTPLMPLRYRTPPTHNTQPPLAHLPGTRRMMMLSYRRMMGSPPGTVEGSGIMEERRMLKILLRMERMRLRGMLLVGRRLGGGRLLVEWVGLFHAFSFLWFLSPLSVCTMYLVSSMGLYCFALKGACT